MNQQTEEKENYSKFLKDHWFFLQIWIQILIQESETWGYGAICGSFALKENS